TQQGKGRRDPQKHFPWLAGSSSRQLHFNPQTLIRFHFLVPLLMSSLCLHHQSTHPRLTPSHLQTLYYPISAFLFSFMSPALPEAD
uniref:Uncharacterized protein n=1 Tax=Hippocampus comes TaxID=109280 RepID=A0A3Q3DPG0_HIPCM